MMECLMLMKVLNVCMKGLPLVQLISLKGLGTCCVLRGPCSFGVLIVREAKI